jgi:uncharacterized membrane protein
MPFGPAFGKPLITREDDARVVDAISRAEQGSRGEVRVHLERKCSAADPMDRARELFAELGMHDTQEGTGVLLYVALDPRVACVYAGEGVHGAAQPGFWDEVVECVATGFGSGRAADGLIQALDKVGDLLRKTVPGDDRHGDELPNVVSTS